MTTYSNYEQRLLDQQSGAELDRLAARRARRPTEEPLTREKFAELLDACLGAHLHHMWTLSGGTPQEQQAAEKAATDARIALQTAVFP
jgi:hypothetical protein